MFEDKTAQSRDKILQCLAWYNNNKFEDQDNCRNLVLIGTAAGKIKLIDIEKNRVLFKEDFGDKNIIYDMDWSVNSYVAIGGMAKELFVRKFEKSNFSFTKLKSIAVSESIRCCQFNRHRP